MVKIGIAGYGFVGQALHTGFKARCDELNVDILEGYVDSETTELQFTLYDPFSDHPDVTDDITKLVHCDFVFVCVPTPTNFAEGKQDPSIVKDVVDKICCYSVGYVAPVIVIKSTVAPGTTKELQQAHPANKIVFNPEFLTEKNHIRDFLKQNRIVLGGIGRDKVENLYRKWWPMADYYLMNSTEAEVVKYAANAFLATKVAFFNEIFFLASALEIDYTTVADAVTRDERIGEWGSKVPGHDGQHGFGGKCFPKDLVTLLRLGGDLCVPNFVQRGTWKTNEAVREVQDWHDIKGASTENLHG